MIHFKNLWLILIQVIFLIGTQEILLGWNADLNQKNTLFSPLSSTVYKNSPIEGESPENLEQAEKLLHQGLENYQASHFEAAIKSWQQALIL